MKKREVSRGVGSHGEAFVEGGEESRLAVALLVLEIGTSNLAVVVRRVAMDVVGLVERVLEIQRHA